MSPTVDGATDFWSTVARTAAVDLIAYRNDGDHCKRLIGLPGSLRFVNGSIEIDGGSRMC
jgi:hypothetical protein